MTGSSGIGKSTIIANLKKRGFTAYDTDDMPQITRLEDSAGQPVAWPDGYVDWSRYKWNWQAAGVEQLLNSNETVFVGAIPSNWKKFVDKFDTIIVLVVDPKVQLHRLKTRQVHAYGQHEQNLIENVYHQAVMRDEAVARRAIVVANDRPTDEVVDEILTYVST